MRSAFFIDLEVQAGLDPNDHYQIILNPIHLSGMFRCFDFQKTGLPELGEPGASGLPEKCQSDMIVNFGIDLFENRTI